jgi:hypothetical protein
MDTLLGRRIWLKRLFLRLGFLSALFLALSLAACTNSINLATPPSAGNEDPLDETAIQELVIEFGKKLQMVSLLAPEDVLRNNLEENYGDLVSPDLLEKWIGDPTNAPGRLVSSPWPDRIEVTEIQKTGDEEYKVMGNIIEVTSAGKEGVESAAERPITLTVVKIEGSWVIDDVSLGDYEDTATVCYIVDYGFRVRLPLSWTGYTVVQEKWEGHRLDAQGNVEEDPSETGPLVLIRHPGWTEENPRQDIPVMVFTHVQWEALENGEFHIGAAPTNPSRLGRNSEYVFALPARYNYAFPEGYEEVEDIIESGAFEAFDR